MARARTRVKRSFYLLVALCILFLLLQLGEWLPGTWKGGGQGGFRAGGEMGLLDPRRGETAVDPTNAPQDPGTVEAPSAPPRDWPPKDGLLVQVVGPDGAPRTDWRLGIGGGEAENHAPDDGSVKLRDERVFTEGFRVRAGGALLRHRLGLDVPATRYVVHVPAGEVPRRRRPGPVEVEIVDPATGEPVPGARVSWHELPDGAGVAERRITTADAQGKARIPDVADGQPFPVTVDGPEHSQGDGRLRAESVWLRPRERGTTRIELPERVVKRFRVRWADRREAVVTRAGVYAADGRLLWLVSFGNRAPSPDVELELPAHELEGAHLLLRVSHQGAERYETSVPLHEVGAGGTSEVVLPEPRHLRVLARDVQGEPVADATVEVTLERGEAEEGAPLPATRARTNRGGEAVVALPPGYGCRVVVQRGSLGPATRRFSPADGSDTLEVVLTEGIMIPVRARPAGGAGLLRLLEGRADVRGVRVDQRLLVKREQSEDEPALLGPFPPGPVELFVAARAHAWAARVVDARPAMAAVDVPLARAHPLMFVVEDPFGVPIQGATIELTRTDGDEPLVLPPSAFGLRTDKRGRAGLPTQSGISGNEIPAGTYEARVAAPGYAPQTIRGLRPGGALHFVTLLREP